MIGFGAFPFAVGVVDDPFGEDLIERGIVIDNVVIVSSVEGFRLWRVRRSWFSIT